MTWIYWGDGKWRVPTAEYGNCDHPRETLRFDPRFAVPVSMYCRACGQAWLHPFHGLTDEEIESAKRRGKELADALGIA